MTEMTDSEFFVVDSSGWIEYIGGGPRSDAYAPYLDKENNLLVPTIVLYEVVKKLTTTRGKTEADRFVSHALRLNVVALSEDLALAAVHLSIERKLAMADSMIYATAQAYQAELVTGDNAFRGLPGVIMP